MMRRQLRSKVLCIAIFWTALSWAGDFSDFKSHWVPSDVTLLDRQGLPIQVLRQNAKIRQLAWTELKDVPQFFIDAVLASEDRRFYEHGGVDWIALMESAKRKVLNQSSRGASTLSMQVAAYLDSRLKPQGRNKHRNWEQKIGQVREAWKLERSWSKNEILEAYINVVDFRGELRGIGAASKGLFGKSPGGLSREESLVLAALIRDPEAQTETLFKRACALSRAMGILNECDALHSTAKNLGPHSIAPEINLAPHVGRQLMAQGKMRSTLDRRLQAQVLEILRQNVLAHQSNNMSDASALVVENSSGRVLAYVGSLGSLSKAGDVDGVQAKRQAGSTLKPFLYSLAIEERYLTASSLIDDSAADISLGNGAIYRPQDFDHIFHGANVTLSQALGSSLNVPAVRTLKMIGVDRLVKRLEDLGFRDLKSEEYYGPSLALGSADVTLWDLVNAYRTLSNQGIWGEMKLSEEKLSGANKSRSVISAQAAFIVNGILADADNRNLTFGLDSPMSLPFWAAVKTGTSKDMRDNWCVGFSKLYTVGVWAGNFSGKPMWNVSGVTGAAPAWAQIMEALPQLSSSNRKSPALPAGVIRLGDSWYIKGTEPREVNSDDGENSVVQAKIKYPVEGMFIAPDPDIPAPLQRVYFEASPYGNRGPWKWILNGTPVPQDHGEVYAQLTRAGSYDLKLMNESGALLDEVHFSVRGSL